jgi:ligand-binding SRPBCC domain-containing protein
MRIIISTTVNQHFLDVMKGFNEDLFRSLSPPFPPVKLLRFDGSKKGDLVSLELNFFLFKQVWTSEITEDFSGEREIYFVDKGVKLPFFLGTWEHKHRIINRGDSETEIRDEITFQGSSQLLTPLLYPILFLQFLYRKPIYKRIFARKSV